MPTVDTKHVQRTRLHPQRLDDPLFTAAEFAVAIDRHLLSLYRYMRTDPDFPKPLRIKGRLAWRKSVIEAYINSEPKIVKAAKKSGAA